MLLSRKSCCVALVVFCTTVLFLPSSPAVASGPAFAAAQEKCVSLDGQSRPDIAPPSGLHWIRMEDRLRLVFSRSEDDTEDNRDISYYMVCWGPRDCESTTSNFLDFSRASELTKLQALVFAVRLDGTPSCASRLSRLDLDLTINQASMSKHVNGSQVKGAGPQPQCYSTPPTQIYAPFFGSQVILGSTANTNATSSEWSYWQHKSGFHRPRGGINGSDDTYAWDVNLNVIGASSNLDVGMDFFAAGYGWAVNWGGNAPGAGTAKQVLIDHCGWFTGYLHGTAIRPKANDYLTPWTTIGKVSRNGADNDHLHFVVYRGTNGPGTLISYNATLLPSTLTISTTTPSLRVGQSASLTATANRSHVASGAPSISSVGLNSVDVFPNTWWKSSNTQIVTVDGYGKITGKARGSASITLYYSGTKKVVNVTIN